MAMQIKNRWYSLLRHRLSDIRVDPTIYLDVKEQLRAERRDFARSFSDFPSFDRPIESKMIKINEKVERIKRDFWT
jgi:hypothetical protein